MPQTATEITNADLAGVPTRMSAKTALKNYIGHLENDVIALHSLWLQIPDDLTDEANQALWNLVNRIRH